jgi:hypothetical protein
LPVALQPTCSRRRAGSAVVAGDLEVAGGLELGSSPAVEQGLGADRDGGSNSTTVPSSAARTRHSIGSALRAGLRMAM